MKNQELEAMGLMIELIKWFRAKGTHPTVASIAIGKFVATSHAMNKEEYARKLHALFIEGLNKEFEQVLAIKKALLNEHTDEGRKIQ